MTLSPRLPLLATLLFSAVAIPAHAQATESASASTPQPAPAATPSAPGTPAAMPQMAQAGAPAPAAPPSGTPPTTPPDTLPEVVVTERSTNLVGKADTATQGTVGARQLQQRPIIRIGELLETIPGLIVTQHSGGGKANQYFVRGFNLDHGTDFATWVMGMPVNMRTHAHGQGYTDLNFLIAELIDGIEYQKGSYLAKQGDFSAAGSVYINLADQLNSGFVSATGGTFNFGRLAVGDSPQVGKGRLLYGLELQRYDGPWQDPDNFRKVNAILRYTQGTERERFAVTGMAYFGKWNSTDQIPSRAVRNGGLDFYDAIDPTDGGDTHRVSLSGEYGKKGSRGQQTQANLYFVDSHVNLWSNFTYFLDDPVRGDQFEQAERRRMFGGNGSHKWNSRFGKYTAENEVGLQIRHDDLDPVGLYLTQGRRRFRTIREDEVQETSIAPYLENRVRWNSWFRTVLGARFDAYRFDVDSSIGANSGKEWATIASPKLNLIFGPWNKTELYLNAAQGFHSNDARGTTIRRDPKTGDPASPVTPLVRADLAEVGVRTSWVKGLQSTLSLWYLKLDSELLFVGDAGTTEASRPSRRTGIEFTNYYTPNDWLTLDADVAFSRARFSDSDPAGRRIPGAVEGVISAGATIDRGRGWFGGLRLRYFGPRPLQEDNRVRSNSTTLVNARLGYHLNRRTRVALEIFNLFDSRDHDIDYFYESRLRGEPAAGRSDIHFHPVESRTFRFSIFHQF